MTEKAKPHFGLFAVWRLIAAILVMIYHFSAYGPEAYQALNIGMERLTPMLDMFFIISGLLIWFHYADRIQSWQSLRVFIVRRLARIYPLHLVTLSFFCVVALAVHFGLVSTADPERYSLAELGRELLLINAWGTGDVLGYNYVSWSLSAEWFAYLAFPLIVFIYRRNGLIGLVTLLLCCVALLEGATKLKLMPFPTWLEANTWGAYRVLADFVLGAILADCILRHPVKVKSHLAPWGLFALSMLMMISGVSSGYLTIAVIALSLYVAGCIDLVSPEKGRYLRPLMPVAAASFGMYLWHPVLAVTLLGFGWRHVLEPMQTVPFTAILIVGLIASTIVAMISARLIEQPMRAMILCLAESRKTKRQKASNRASAIPAE